MGYFSNALSNFSEYQLFGKIKRATTSETATDIEDSACKQENSSPEKVIQAHDLNGSLYKTVMLGKQMLTF